MKKKINIPFFGTDDQTLNSIKEIRKNYLGDWNIIGSEITTQSIQYIENGLTKNGEIKNGVNLVFEKRKSFVLDPSIAELIKKVDQNEVKIEDNKKTDKYRIKVDNIFPKIDYHYWMNKNPFYSNDLLLPTMKECIINYASKPGLINDVVENIDNMSCKKLVSIIEDDIKIIISENLFENKDQVLRVFDLINGWGGRMGRSTYVKPKGNTTRSLSASWYKYYLNGVEKAIKGDKDGLLDFTKIENIGDSFGTKHLYFWSLFGGETAIPIYDNRIKTLLYFRMDIYPAFNQYLENMNEFAQKEKITIHQLEKALFAFSSNYFPNEELIIKDDFKDNTDYNEASRLEELYNSI